MPGSTSDAFDVRVGCDVQSVEDVRASIDASGERYLRRVLGDAELLEAAALPTPELVARYTSGRFAAKEAVYKALRGRPDTVMGWHQIQIVADDAGAPRVLLNGSAADLAAASGIADVAVSISHADLFAFAVATAVAHTA
jgi:holo-[acyl-carrier protein] synthase